MIAAASTKMDATTLTTKEEQRAVETLLTLGCVDAGKLPWWVWRRTVAACLREGTYEFEPVASRRRGRRGTKLDGAKELRDRVRYKLGVDRLPAGIGEKLERWGAELVDKVSKRKEYAKEENRGEARKKVRWEGVRRRAEAELKRWGVERKLVRAGGKTFWSAVEPSQTMWAPDIKAGMMVKLEASPVPIDYRQQFLRPETGQIEIQARVTCMIGLSWYGRVHKRGIAVIDDCFVVDVVGFGPAVDGGESLIVRCAVPTIGFQIEMQNRAVHLVSGHARFLTAAEEAALRAEPWMVLDAPPNEVTG
jgi:hypothetical protein